MRLAYKTRLFFKGLTLYFSVILLFGTSIQAQLNNPDDIYWSNHFAPTGIEQTTIWTVGDLGNNTVCYAGEFSRGDGNSYSLAIWDGEEWSIEGPGYLLKFPYYSGQINAIAGINGNIIIGGDFNMIGSDSIAYIALWDGEQWHPLGYGINGPVESIATTGNTDFYIGGSFTRAGNDTANNVAHWTGSAWEPLTDPTETSNGVNGTVLDITVGNDAVYLGGKFTHATGVTVNYIAKWNWTTKEWSDLAGGVNFWVYTVEAAGDGIYAGGVFNMIGGEPFNYIAKWVGGQWEHLGSGSSNNVFDIEYSPSMGLYAVGDFSQDAGPGGNQLARWINSQWQSLGNPEFYSGSSPSIAVTSSFLYVLTSRFSRLPGTKNARGIAAWNGSEWAGLGSGIGPIQYSDQIAYHTQSLGWYNNTVFVGGTFKSAGDDSINSLVKWENDKWTRVGESDLQVANASYLTEVNAMEVWNDRLYIAGKFDTISGMYLRNIASWDGSAWQNLGDGVGNQPAPDNGKVTTIHQMNNKLYIGGYFNEAGNIPVKNIAVWDGTTWDSLGSGILHSTIESITHYGNMLYVGGGFNSAGGVPVNMIAQWDGTSWSDVGGGVSQGASQTWVHALAVTAAGDLIVGGEFSMVGSEAANNIARWDGTNWHSLGEGIDGKVYSIYVNGTDIYVGGTFYRAGTDSIQGIAKWNGTGWEALGSGIPIEQSFSTITNVLDLLGTPRGLYAAGEFMYAGSGYSNEIALWENYTPTAIEPESNSVQIPQQFQLSQNYPNPFNPITTIEYALPKDVDVQLVVYDITGRQVKTLVNKKQSAGRYSIQWKGMNDNGQTVSSGIYIYRIVAGANTQNHKMVYLK